MEVLRESMAVACGACSGEHAHRIIEAREMMFGLRNRFRYQECAACGHIQLLDVPRDLSRYYPPEYYSLSPAAAAVASAPGAPARWRSALLLRLPFGVVDRMVAWGPVDPAFRSLAGLGLSTRSRICDVGAGNGELLLRLWERGLRHLVGVDPYVERDVEVAPSIWVRKRTVDELDGTFDAILLNHSFEHMAEPGTVLATLRNRLAPGGVLVVRTPLAGGLAWRRYGADWVGLDPPRHLFVPTERSMRLLAQRAEMHVARVFHDSHALQFWGSEQYRQNIPLRDPRSWVESPKRAVFSPGDIARWHWQARRLNVAGDGDSAGFVLRRD